MSIKRIEITGYRSIAYLNMKMNQITTLIGRNGSGKSNILSALNYFYKNLLTVQDEQNSFDTNNRLRNEICIRITYDLKQILKIIKRNLNDEKKEYENYYKKVLAISNHDEIIVELVKRKGKEIRWNVSYNTRQIIASLFPVYFIDSRQIELTDWTNLWNLIGDLFKFRNEDSERIQSTIRTIVESNDSSVKKKLNHLQDIFEQEHINVKRLTSRQIGQMLAEMLVGGQRFQYDEKNLREYSNGTNAFNYTTILIDILAIMKKYKLKEPIIVLDEPEISLHHTMIDQLMEKIFWAADQVQFLLSTHSARCVKMLLENEEDISAIYHVALKENYSKVRRVRNLSEQEERERIVVTESYTGSCFAKMILNVEGETELELFKNKYLRMLFPVLKEVEIVMGMSNKVVHNLTAPSKRNYQIPGLAVMDMDKVLAKKDGENAFLFTELKDYQIDREIYHYGAKRQKTLALRRRIKRMCSQCKFSYRYPLFSCDDPNFECLLDLIVEYYRNYDVFLWRNTVEGALITAENQQVFKKYVNAGGLSLEERKNTVEYWKLFQDKKNLQLNYLRMLFSGKPDYLLTKKQIKKQNPQIDENLWNVLCTVKKTSGWVSKWLEFYFLDLAEIQHPERQGFREFGRWIEADANYQQAVEAVQKNFPQLYALVHKIEVTLR